MTGPQLDPGVREVLTAPRGHRFSHTRTGRRPVPATREELFDQMMEHPKVRYRVEHGEVPPWMATHAARLTRQAAPAPEEPRDPPPPPTRPPARPPTPFVPRPRPAPDDGPRPKPPLPRRPHSHRKPCSLTGWRLAAYALAAATGALAHHLATVLL
ncbi:hypothetical protein [Nocardiopsis metallicus]|uniref:Uncharacterized protein n=1 Tax=Nocardiopsis metallicus TaxID=179819 RepID=A0A840W649_9ACTN|nr:hypothetical protein [Nocardiopsis metallicus]MBB5490823.1 hypothetical protein [Nocardiopsis metallicus]